MPKLPEGFDLTVVNLEFKLEKEKDLTSEVIHELIGMYTQAADFYDKQNERDRAELYRMKMTMLFCKPKVL
jgi:hypothetical protein